jgi:hypothetical protein
MLSPWQLSVFSQSPLQIHAPVFTSSEPGSELAAPVWSVSLGHLPSPGPSLLRLASGPLEFLGMTLLPHVDGKAPL